MERQIDFSRDRHLLCGSCGHRWLVDLDWIDRWEQGREECPGCRMTCEHEESARVTVDPDDSALDDDQVPRFFWYHTSTQPDWPKRDFDPAAGLTADTRRRMGGDRRVAAWAARQRAKALHVGTYEAAIHNMLRRIHDQADQDSQFYLYRVHLRPSIAVRDGWVVDPSNFVGDVVLGKVCPPGVDVARYLNFHEDPGGLSLALGRGAIASVQQVAVPLLDSWDDGWVRDAVAALGNATETVAPATGGRRRSLPSPPSPQVRARDEIGAALAGRLPINIREQFASAAVFAQGDDPLHWARHTSSLFDLIENPGRMLEALDGQEHRLV